LLSAADLEELIAPSLEDYESTALKLAKDRSLLNSFRERVESNRHSGRLFDTTLFTRHIESAYTQMWEQYQRGE
jgi:predicted O-linked N-acetylglucosamine transferase (SPINDLY family)